MACKEIISTTISPVDNLKGSPNTGSLNRLTHVYTLTEPLADCQPLLSQELICRIEDPFAELLLELLIINKGVLGPEVIGTGSGKKLVEALSTGGLEAMPLALVGARQGELVLLPFKRVIEASPRAGSLPRPGKLSVSASDQTTEITLDGDELIGKPRLRKLAIFEQQASHRRQPFKLFEIDYSQEPSFRDPELGQAVIFLREALHDLRLRLGSEETVKDLIRFICVHADHLDFSYKDKTCTGSKRRQNFFEVSLLIFKAVLGKKALSLYKASHLPEIRQYYPLISDCTLEENIRNYFYLWVTIFTHFFPDRAPSFSGKFRRQKNLDNKNKRNELHLEKAARILEASRLMLSGRGPLQLPSVYPFQQNLWLATAMGKADVFCQRSCGYSLSEDDQKQVVLFNRGLQACFPKVTLASLRKKALLARLPKANFSQTVVEIMEHLAANRKIKGAVVGRINALTWFCHHPEKLAIARKLKKLRDQEVNKAFSGYKNWQKKYVGYLLAMLLYHVEGQEPTAILTKRGSDDNGWLLFLGAQKAWQENKVTGYPVFSPSTLRRFETIKGKTVFPNFRLTQKEILLLLAMRASSSFSSQEPFNPETFFHRFLTLSAAVGLSEKDENK